MMGEEKLGSIQLRAPTDFSNRGFPVLEPGSRRTPMQRARKAEGLMIFMYQIKSVTVRMN
jgi:hypothetical protein